ncbi:MAG: HAMP domain-containing histidine kinase [Clostridiales bacterium]|jgi:signal transduction histidine kinase|nr:HAMP domain-containing histidine kinase [Clostridiales bacterium]
MTWLIAALTIGGAFFGLRFFLLRREVKRLRGEIMDLADNARYGKRLHLEEGDATLETAITAINKLVDGYEERLRHSEEMERNMRLNISAIAHDLRTPLTSLTGYLQLLSKEPLTDKQRGYIDTIFNAAITLRDLTENFYEISRLDLGEYVMALQPINLEHIVCETFLGFYQNFVLKKIEVDIAEAERPPIAIADDMALKRILHNIIQNLLRYAKGAVSISFQTSFQTAERENAHAVIIRNETDAPLPEDIERIFERFYMADTSRSHNGAGIGLYVSRKLIRAMNGDIIAWRQDGALYMKISLPVILSVDKL